MQSKDSSFIEHYLNAMGIVQWEERTAKPMESPSMAPFSPAPSWETLEQTVSQCEKCALCKTRKNTVFGHGSHKATLMLIGEAPGANEDAQGKPFVGRAGQLLTEMLRSIGFSREQVYICNVLKCRPPLNRDPTAEEVIACTEYLKDQIKLLNPKLLLALGRVAAHHLLGLQSPLSQLRGQRFAYGEAETPLLVTYHPAYLLRNPKDKGKSYQDLLLAKRFLEKEKI